MYISAYCYGTTACQGQGLLNSQTAFCLVAVTLTVANLVSCRQLAGHISLATTLSSVTELTLATVISVTEGGQMVTLH